MCQYYMYCTMYRCTVYVLYVCTYMYVYAWLRVMNPTHTKRRRCALKTGWCPSHISPSPTCPPCRSSSIAPTVAGVGARAGTWRVKKQEPYTAIFRWRGTEDATILVIRPARCCRTARRHRRPGIAASYHERLIPPAGSRNERVRLCYLFHFIHERHE